TMGLFGIRKKNPTIQALAKKAVEARGADKMIAT
ncbi:unnamed protein product, partial [marine sediment metagenome]